MIRKIENKQAEMHWYIVAAIITALVVGIVVFSFTDLGIIELLDKFLPSFNQTGNGANGGASGEGENVEEQVFLNDREGRCKPFEGEYSLKDGKLELWNGNEWENIDELVADYNDFWLRVIKETLIELEETGLKINFEGEYDIELLDDGLGATLGDGETYIYTLDNNVDNLHIIVESNENVESRRVLLPEAESIYDLSDDEKEKYEGILVAFKKAIDEQELEIGTATSKLYFYKYELYCFLYVTVGQEDYGINSDHEFYFKSTNSPTDWKSAEEYTAGDVEYEYRVIKDKLVEACK